MNCLLHGFETPWMDAMESDTLDGRYGVHPGVSQTSRGHENLAINVLAALAMSLAASCFCLMYI
eukprot:scaffold121660_cov24-Prasinocladus_malaysianus.AAC.1